MKFFMIALFTIFNSVFAHNPHVSKIGPYYQYKVQVDRIIKSIENPSIHQINLAQNSFYLLLEEITTLLEKKVETKNFLTFAEQNILYYSTSQYLILVDSYLKNIKKPYESTINWEEMLLNLDFTYHFNLLYQKLAPNDYFRETLKERFPKEALPDLKKIIHLMINDEELINKMTFFQEFNPESTLETILIRRHPLFKEFEENGSLESLENSTFFLIDKLKRPLHYLGKIPAWTFGKVFGTLSFREGHLKKNKELSKIFEKNLRPFDLIFEKKSYLITDYTIPGHFGHVAIWLGTKKDLKEIKIWDHPLLKPFQDKISKGYSIFEMRRWGVGFDEISNWLNLDETAIIRPKFVKNLSPEDFLEIYVTLFHQIGSHYDFQFDIMTSKEITCTELIVKALENINWPSQNILGRESIIPDDMAKLLMSENSPLEFIGSWEIDDDNLKSNSFDEFAEKIFSDIKEREIYSSDKFLHKDKL